MQISISKKSCKYYKCVHYYKNIYGIEKEYRLSKVSKVSSIMYGQDGIQIVYGDGLVHHDKIEEGGFKVLVANPPYSVTGFLKTLSKEERNAYALGREIKDKAVLSILWEIYSYSE